jgi:hypothetical protein
MTAQFWGPVAVWVAGLSSLLTVTVALLGGLGWFARRSRPRLAITFEQAQPWCRTVKMDNGSNALWVRIAVENRGMDPARGCVGRLTGLETEGTLRLDIDPVQLRWAGFPRSHGFDPIDLRRGQREFLDVAFRPSDALAEWIIDTFQDRDFDPGFATRLPADQVHVFQIALFADNADTCGISLRLEVRDDEPRMTATDVK